MQQAIQTINDNLEDIQRKANLEMTKLLPIVPADTDFDGPPTLGQSRDWTVARPGWRSPGDQYRTAPSRRSVAI